MSSPIVMKRSFAASLADVWDLWTTKDGLESWWCPDGFTVEVKSLDLRVGGVTRYVMTATRQQEVDSMKAAGMPVSSEYSVTYTEIVRHRRLVYQQVMNMAPGVPPYPLNHVVELREEGSQVHMVVTIDPMHDERWTQASAAGWEEEMLKLSAALKR